MKKLVLTTVMLFLSTFFFITENAWACGDVQQPTWVEDFGGGIVCSIDGTYSYGIDVIEEDEYGNEQKRVVVFSVGQDIMQAFDVRSAIVKNSQKFRRQYGVNGTLALDIKVLLRSPSCDIETRRIKFVQQKTGH